MILTSIFFGWGFCSRRLNGRVRGESRLGLQYGFGRRMACFPNIDPLESHFVHKEGRQRVRFFGKTTFSEGTPMSQIIERYRKQPSPLQSQFIVIWVDFG